jgi:TonB family protein
MMKTIKRKTRPWKMFLIASVIPLAFMIIACHDQISDDAVTIVESSGAVPEGGLAIFFEHIGRKLNYPAEAKKNKIQGKVFVEFVVNTDGSIDVTGTSGIGGGCDLEAATVVQSAPKWKPATINGVPVSQKMVLPINFKLAIPEQAPDVKAPEGAMNEVVVVTYP